MIGIILIAGIGCGHMFRYHIKFDNGQVTIVLAFFCHQHLA
jgi:hypothetical protein